MKTILLACALAFGSIGCAGNAGGGAQASCACPAGQCACTPEKNCGCATKKACECKAGACACTTEKNCGCGGCRK